MMSGYKRSQKGGFLAELLFCSLVLIQLVGCAWAYAVGANTGWAVYSLVESFFGLLGEEILELPQPGHSIFTPAVHFVGHLLFDASPLVLVGVAVAHRYWSPRDEMTDYRLLHFAAALDESVVADNHHVSYCVPSAD